ncbi:magnesium transporter CorA family protein [Lactobacillus terrae]|uniref:magnesium transporter CorA family protein n=1 Tax=Lactobacillus terrae TaxID=2269374 RepID=UPI000C1B7812|nr:magnesium transporter CorA family protein [Lactobacillus terrae]
MIENVVLKDKTNLVLIKSEASLSEDDKKILLSEKYKLTDEIIEYVSDKNERARTEFDEHNRSWLIVYNIQRDRSKNKTFKPTIPISFVIKDNKIFCFTIKYSEYIDDYILRADNHYPVDHDNRHWSMIFYVMDLVSSDFEDSINDFNIERNRIQKHLNSKKTTDEEILNLAKLEDAIIYLSTAISGNQFVVSQLFATSDNVNSHMELTKITRELLNDSLIEINQVKEQASICSDIIGRTTNTYNNILNNQTNTSMRILTIYTILLSIPTIVSGFYGMNMFLPIADKKSSWIISLIITLVIMVVVLLDLRRRKIK